MPEEVYISLSLEELGNSGAPSTSLLPEVHSFRIYVQDREALLEPRLMLMCVSLPGNTRCWQQPGFLGIATASLMLIRFCDTSSAMGHLLLFILPLF